MFQKGMIVFLFFLSFLNISCSDELVEPAEKKAVKDVTVGEVHNQFVQAYLERCTNREQLTRKERIQTYVEITTTVCEEKNYDFKPTQMQMDEFLATCEQWRKAGIWDIFNPGVISPDDALDRFVAAGIIPDEHALYLHQLLQELKQEDIKLRGVLSCPTAPCAEMEAAKDLLQSSCRLWCDQSEAVPGYIEFADNPELAQWWKTVIKYIGVGACDGLAGWAAAYASGANPFVIGFVGGIASVAAYDAFDERGW